MKNLNILPQSQFKTFLVLSILVFVFGQKLAAQGWETFIGDNDLELNTSYQSYSMGDGNYLTYNLRNVGSARSISIYKLNAYGEIGWELEFPQGNVSYNSTNPILACGNGEFVTAYNVIPPTGGNTPGHLFLVKFDSEGNTLWEHEVFPDNISDATWIFDWINAPDGGFYFYATQGIQPSKNYLGKMSCDGNLETFNLMPSPSKIAVRKMVYIDDELHVLGGKIFPFASGEFSYAIVEGDSALAEPIVFDDFTPTIEPILTDDNEFIFIDKVGDQIIQIKTDLVGTILSEDIIYDQEGFTLHRMYHVGDGLILTGYRAPIGPNGQYTGFAMKSNFDGELIWDKFYDHRNAPNDIWGAINAEGGGYILSGRNESQGYVIKVDEMGNIYTNSLLGNVSRDIDMDCDSSQLDVPLANWLVTAEKAGDTFIGSTDSMGNYFIPVDTGNYVVTCHYPNDYWTSCNNDSMIIISDFGNEINIDYSISALVDCPLMTIDGNTPFLRPCFDRPGFFQYCNEGTVTAVDARIEITLDPAVTATASSIPWTSQVDNTYIFELGDLASLECGSFSMSFFLDCDASVGDSYSVKAQAFPDSLCTPPNPLYSGAFIELSGICDNEEIIFTIENVGDQPMDTPLPYIIVEDVVLGYTDEVLLIAGEKMDIPLTSNGSTFTMLSEQVANAPGNSNPLLVLEGCGTNDQGEYSTGFSNQFGLDDGQPACDLDLVVARNSFDPNAKSAYPEGYGTMHFIEPNTPLEYFIYFQNTGSDTAFTVVLRDTLDEWLDLPSFEAGASSHNYTYQFGENRTLKFTFDQINLPDSTTNELGSNGFVSFKINPKASTPLTTVITNKAAIYFDYNEPIITNETFHTIGENFIEVIINSVTDSSLDSDADIIVTPNPFMEQTVISVKNHIANRYELSIFDLQGRLVRYEVYNSAEIVFNRKAMIDGIYFYHLKSDNGLVAAGKLIVK